MRGKEDADRLSNAKQEQVLDDVARLYLVLRDEDAELAATVKSLLVVSSPLMTKLVDYLDAQGRSLKMEEIRTLPLPKRRPMASSPVVTAGAPTQNNTL